MKKILNKHITKLLNFAFYLFVFSLPWQTKLILRAAESNFNEISLYFSQILLLIFLFLYLVYKLLHKGEVERRGHNLSLYFFLSFLLLSSLSFFISTDKALCAYHFLVILSGVALFTVLKEGFSTSAYVDSIFNKTKVFFIFLGSMFVHVFLGIYQFLTQSSFAFKYLGLAAHNPADLGVSVVESSSGRWLRSYGGFDHPNIFAGVLVVSIILAAYLLSKKKLIRTRKEIAESLFLFVFYFFSILALLFTFSRSAWLSLVVGLVFLFIFLLFKKEKWPLGRLAALMVFSLLLTSLIVFSYKDLFLTRFEVSSRLEQKSLIERNEQLTLNKELLADNWLIGLGLGNYNRVLREKDLSQGVKKADWEYQPVHNSFLLILSEVGVFAFIFFIAALISIFYRGREEAFAWSLMISLIFLMLFDHWLISLPFGLIFFFFVLGII